MSMHLEEKITKQFILHTQKRIAQILNINYSEIPI